MFIEIDGWRSNIKFSACHFIPEYKGAPRVHGYTYTVNIRIHGEPNEQGIILDFEKIKSRLSTIVDRFDHKVIIPRNAISGEEGGNIEFQVGEKYYSIPTNETIVIDLLIPSAEELCRIILQELMTELDVPDNVTMIELGLDESYGQGAWSSWKNE
jgi:6-pyruvoyl tetrahydropterin synthase/QueD family protein